jgi:hypothetical protein
MANAHDMLTLSVYVGSYCHSSGKGGVVGGIVTIHRTTHGAWDGHPIRLVKLGLRG